MFATADPVFLGQMVLGAVQVLTLVTLGMKVFIRKPPLEAEFATRTELKELGEQLHGRITDSKLQIGREINEMHEKVNTIAGDVKYLRGRWDQKEGT